MKRIVLSEDQTDASSLGFRAATASFSSKPSKTGPCIHSWPSIWSRLKRSLGF